MTTPLKKLNCIGGKQPYSLCNTSISAYIIQVEFNRVGENVLHYGKIGEQIRYYRRKRGLSQEQLAEKVWISSTHMSHIETGQTKLSLPVLVDLAAALEVTPNDLLRGQYSEDSAGQVDPNGVLEHCSAEQAAVLRQILQAAKDAMDRYL